MVNKGAYRAPWTRQKELQRRYQSDEVPDIPELVNIISKIKMDMWQWKYHTRRARALFAMYYLTGCRASEIVKCLSLRRQKIQKKVIIDAKGRRGIIYDLDKNKNTIVEAWKDEHEYLGIKKRDISFPLIGGKRCILIRTENRKNHNRKTKRQPIPIDKELPIAKFVKYHYNSLEENEIMFPFGAKRATQIINETTGFNIHFIRHIRATHLITKYDFNEQMLIKFMGWTDGRPAKNYLELKHHDVFRQFYKNGGEE